jgi:uncharacterized protein YigE (DUF2233 family)
MFLLLLPAAARAECGPLRFEGATYTVCRFELGRDRIVLFDADAAGKPYGSFAALANALGGEGKSLAFAMNAGMYDEALRPIGLYVEGGREIKKINLRKGGGNFHLMPNGVFYVKGTSAGVVESRAFARARVLPDYATQSGPMLVIDGAIHPKFSARGTSLKRRNGVGVAGPREVVFAISEGAVNFHAFARLFRDRLGCRNALFFDGTVSSLHAPDLGRSDAIVPLGPIVAVVR